MTARILTALLREWAHRLGGEVAGAQVLCPGPGHDRRDRSLSVKLSTTSPLGFIAHSFAGDDWRVCRDYVAERLGLSNGAHVHVLVRESPRDRTTPIGAVLRLSTSRGELAVECWNEARDPRGTIAETYLRIRGLELVSEIAGAIVRFHPSCAWREGDRTIRVPAMVCAMRSIDGDELVAVHRTRLTPDGQKVERRMLGPSAGAAIKLDADDTVLAGLHIGEGVETCLAARQLGLRPTWALGSAVAIATFPILAGVECLTLLAEHDDASAKAVEACAHRWHAAGKEVLINRSAIGKDLADAVRGAA